MDRGVVLVEIVGHGDDLTGHSLGIGSLLQHHVHLPGVLLPGGEAALPLADGAHGLLHGDGILPGVCHPLHAPDRVRMALAHAWAPEGVPRAVGQDGGPQKAHQGKQARVPAGADDGRRLPRLGCRVHVGKVLRDAGVGVEGVHHAVPPGKLRGLNGQVRGAAAAQQQHVHVCLLFHKKRDG